MSEIQEQTTTTLAEYSAIEAGLVALKDRYADKVYEVTTTAGMKDAKLARAELRSSRGDLEKIRKELKGPHIERGRQIDGDANRIKAAIMDIEAPIGVLIKTEDGRKAEIKAEKDRIERNRIEEIQDEINGLRFNLSEYHPVEDIQAFIDGLPVVGDDHKFDEFVDMAKSVITDSLRRAETALGQAEEREHKAQKQAAEKAKLKEQADAQAAEQAELDKQRKEQNDKQKELDDAEAESLARDAEIERKGREQTRWGAKVDSCKHESKNGALVAIYVLCADPGKMTATQVLVEISAICAANIDPDMDGD